MPNYEANTNAGSPVVIDCLHRRPGGLAGTRPVPAGHGFEGRGKGPPYPAGTELVPSWCHGGQAAPSPSFPPMPPLTTPPPL